MNRQAGYNIDDLLYLMARLRDPETGCPWDRQQTLESLVPYTVEETYEVVDTIERGDNDHLPEELGDLLFQIVFYAQLGRETGHFSFEDIVQGLVSKLVERHPHVFPDGTLHSRRETAEVPDGESIGATWERKKREERARKGHSQWLADIPRALPALLRAQKIQKRAARAGFDWPDTAGVVAKIREELDELEAEMHARDRARIHEELGDVLFSVVNLIRRLDGDAESLLRNANRKFETRFTGMEESARHRGQGLEALDAAQLDALWEAAKKDS